MADLDTDKDGKVTLAELSAYYRKHGFVPFQVRTETPQVNPGAAFAFLGGNRAEPSGQAVSDAIFALLDVNKDGKLTRANLAAAPEILLRLDEDDDEMIVPRELVLNADAQAALMAGMQMFGGPGRQPTGSKILVPITTPGEVPAGLVRSIQERYGPKGAKPEEKKLSRKDLGLDEATFARLDLNGDGVLDEQELAGFVKRPPDFELTIHLGKSEERIDEPAGERLGSSALLVKGGLAVFDLGASRAVLRGSSGGQGDQFGELVRQQYLAQFKQADTDNKGYLDEKAVGNNRLYRRLFKAMDRDGDGKLTEKEVIAYLDQYREIQSRASASCVTLTISEQSRGLFDILDTNRDGRLSVREMRGAAKLLDQLDRDRKGYLTKGDIPRSYQLTLRRGATTGGAQGGAGAFFDLYRGTARAEPESLKAGPLWFRKMDRNRDGDVSRKEWLFSDEEFRKIDTDGDGLISLEEAERYDPLLRKQKK
jgi:Ca2+-binding EF-hand superfamily protein